MVSCIPPFSKYSFTRDCYIILLMAEIPHHLGCIKPCKEWDKLPINWCRISAINSRDPDQPISELWGASGSLGSLRPSEGCGTSTGQAKDASWSTFSLVYKIKLEVNFFKRWWNYDYLNNHQIMIWWSFSDADFVVSLGLWSDNSVCICGR